MRFFCEMTTNLVCKKLYEPEFFIFWILRISWLNKLLFI
jgi:hypothetical protein